MTKLLIIDDDLRYLDLLKVMLESEGYEVVASTNGKSLRQLIEAHDPDVVLIDVLLAEDNGILLAAKYRQDATSRDIPFVFMSAWTGVNEMPLPTKSLRLSKPFTLSELLGTIIQSLKGNVASQY